MAALGWLLNLDFAASPFGEVVGPFEITDFESEILQRLAFDSWIRRRLDAESEITQRFSFDSDTY